MRGLFINQAKTQCSIYESGVMISNILKSNPKFELDYVETHSNFATRERYDFCIVNWHHMTLPFTKAAIHQLPGLKIGINLEVSVDNCFPMMPNNLFEVHMIIDPTKNKEKDIFPFPRPLEIVSDLKDILDNEKKVIGSFGFCGNNDKRFDEILHNFGGEECIIRFNIPFATYMHKNEEFVRDHVAKLRKICKPNIDLRITHDYMSKVDLIRWCSEHTINIFPYHRNIPGLSAVTDQAISAGRAIAITSCNTFRHLHKYISHYPKQSYEELMASTLPGIKQMQIDWHYTKFNERFDELIESKI